jgi:DHA2 family multidrug resistance protein
MVRCSRGRSQAALGLLIVMALIGTGRAAWRQPPDTLGYSVATPGPISPAEGTTNPSAQATQSQNPYLGSVPIPQILQSLYGYRATGAGLVLGPGALVITLFALIAVQLIQRQIVSVRVLLTISLVTVAAAMWYFSTFTPATDYAHYALARAYQGLGYGFFFVPVNVLAYSQLRPDQNNRASSLTNLFRNWGGSFGIAFITTASERRHQFHQTNLGSAIGDTSRQLGGRVAALSNYSVTKGFSGPDAATAADGYLYQELQRQVSLLSFMDCFRGIAWLTLAVVPLLFLIRHFKPAGKAPAAH